MSPEDLRDFLHLLERAGQLTRVPVAVDPNLELATIVDQVSKGAGQGRALLFEKIVGGQLPVAVNLFGRLARVAWALGTTDLEGLAGRLAEDLRASGSCMPGEALGLLTRQPEWQPSVVSRAACYEVDHGTRGLDLLPHLKAWPGDGGAYLTLAQTFTRHPDGGALNCGMYRVQRLDRDYAALRCRTGSGAAAHLAEWHRRGCGMPVAIALGGPPALIWAAGAPLPDGIEEAAFCGYLTGRRMQMCACRHSDLQVPANAEIVIEGVILPGETVQEGPFGNHSGSYEAAAAAAGVRILSVHARRNPVYPWTLVGPPPMENVQLARATEQLFLPMLRMVLPTVQRLHMPDQGIFHRAALVTVGPDEVRPLAEIASLLWSSSLLRGARLLVIGAADHDPRDPTAVFWRILNRVDWSRDLLVDGKSLAVDARRLPAGGPVRCDPGVLAKVMERWHEYRIDDAGKY